MVDAAEECDDGNTSDNDVCLNSCKLARCGDGIIRSAVEECDDGNSDNQDGCTSTCVVCQTSEDDGFFAWDGNGHCYSRNLKEQTWLQAEQQCGQKRGHLVTYNGYEENAVANALVKGRREWFWIGLRDFSPDNGVREFEWVTGEPVRRFNWGADEGNMEGEFCTFQLPGSGKWADWGCEQKTASLCEHPGWLVRGVDGHAYRAFFDRSTFAEASMHCEQQQGHLVTITTAEEQSFVAANFPGVSWIAASDEQTEGTFAWQTGEEFSFDGFAPEEPDGGEEQDCVAIDLDKLWHDRSCGSRYSYICEIAK